MVRVATADTEVLGYHISKGAFINCNSYVCDKPLANVKEEVRSERSRRQKSGFEWFRQGVDEEKNEEEEESMDMSEFRPERWLDEHGHFEPKKLPRLAFSLGPRGCFGALPFFSRPLSISQA